MSEDEKRELIEGFVKLSAEHAFTIFDLCGLKTYIESKVTDSKTGKTYQYSFVLIDDKKATE